MPRLCFVGFGIMAEPLFYPLGLPCPLPPPYLQNE